MTTSRQSNPQYTDEYKLDAVNLARSIGIPAAAQRLGVSDTALRKWDKMVRDRGKDAFVSRKKDWGSTGCPVLPQNCLP